IDDRTSAIDAKNWPGFFEKGTVNDRMVKAVSGDNAEDAIRLGARAKVLQISFIQSRDKGTILGATVNHPGNKYESPLALDYRLTVDEQSAKHSMDLGREDLKTNEEDIWGLVVTNRNGNPSTAAKTYGITIAHEVGHVL